MQKLTAMFVIFGGCNELIALKSYAKFERDWKSLPDLENYKDLSEEKKKQILVLTLQACVMLALSLCELVATVAGMVFFTGTLRWLMFSVLAMGAVSTAFKKLLPTKIFEWWRTFDYLYCATVMIIGVLYWLP